MPDRVNGTSFRHPKGYKPLYPDTDPEAFDAGMAAFGTKKMLKDNPYPTGTEQRESWVDGWLFAANLKESFVPPGSKPGWKKKRGMKVSAGTERSKRR